MDTLDHFTSSIDISFFIFVWTKAVNFICQKSSDIRYFLLLFSLQLSLSTYDTTTLLTQSLGFEVFCSCNQQYVASTRSLGKKTLLKMFGGYRVQQCRTQQKFFVRNFSFALKRTTFCNSNVAGKKN